MAATSARAYLSPTLVLLALDWPDGESRNDFLGFAIQRTPGFLDHRTGQLAAKDWLPNRIDFNGPPAAGKPDFPSEKAPVQKFLWWDARLDGLSAGQKIRYDVWAVTGTPGALLVEPSSKSSLEVGLPNHVEKGIGTWFNRAVVSSQAFSRMVNAMALGGAPPSAAQALKLREWLANGMHKPLPEFIAKSTSLAGAIYHLTDTLWMVPALQGAMAGRKIGLVHDSKAPTNDAAIKALKKVTFFSRNKVAIMHNKFLVDGDSLQAASKQVPKRLACGSANYTTEGLTSQANLIHTFESPELARLYFDRYSALKGNPTLGATAKLNTSWSKTVSIGDAGVRVFYSPEKEDKDGARSQSMETIVRTIHDARSSVIFCLFTPTDADLRDACFSVGDGGKMMFGLINRVAAGEPTLTPTSTGKIPVDQIAALEMYHRSKDNRDVIGAEFFHPNTTPPGFESELRLFPGTNPPPYPPVIIHHKFIVVDAETDNPTIFTGSANMSHASVYKNDENLLEIKGSPRLARTYIAEFMRLYEHYRARARYIDFIRSGRQPFTFSLRGDRGWANAHYTPGTPEYKSRVRMLALG